MAKNSNFPKAMMLYFIRDGFNVTYESVSQAVEQCRLKGLESSLGGIKAMGFVPVMAGGDAPLVHTVGGFAANPDAGGFCLKVGMEARVIPSDCVRRKLKSEIDEIQKREVRFVRGKEKHELEMNIIEAMAVNAPIRYRELSMMVLPSKQLMAVFTSNSADVDDMTYLLRRALGSLPIMPFEVLDFVGFNGVVTGYPQEVCDRISLANQAMVNDGRVTPVFSAGHSVTTSNECEKVRFAGFEASHASVANSVKNDRLNVASIELSFSNAFTAMFHGVEKITGMKWHLNSDDIADDCDGTIEDARNLVLAADLELVSGVVTDLHTYFYPIFGAYPVYEEQVIE
ncbi:MAG: recombination-associated protein RdgC [Shewanella sp.]|uniref:recombination-associated protein RdgC n=1 Tax=Shewanella sp. TaxID=50422 RepID=UPI003F2DF9E8